MRLNREPNFVDADRFYEALIEGQRDMSDAQADSYLAKLVLILSNHIGDRAVLDEAIALARDNTLAQKA